MYMFYYVPLTEPDGRHICRGN